MSIVVVQLFLVSPLLKVIPKVLKSLNWGSVGGPLSAKMHLRVRALPKASKSGLDSNTCFSTLCNMLKQRLNDKCVDCRLLPVCHSMSQCHMPCYGCRFWSLSFFPSSFHFKSCSIPFFHHVVLRRQRWWPHHLLLLPSLGISWTDAGCDMSSFPCSCEHCVAQFNRNGKILWKVLQTLIPSRFTRH